MKRGCNISGADARDGQLQSLIGGRRPCPNKFADHGFTLIELLITVTILPLVIGAISVGLISVFSLQSSVGNRLSNSADAQIVSANFLKDVQSSEFITTQTSSTPQCGTGTQLLGLEWDGGQTLVSYVDVTVTAGSSITYSLVRQYCTLGSSTPSSTATVSYGLSSSQGPPAITCSPTATTCAASTQWIPAAGVSSVTFAITEPKSNLSYSLSATPRAWNPVSGGVPSGGLPYAPFTLLDKTSCSALSLGQGTLTIDVAGGQGNGALGISSDCPGTVTISNGGTLNASAVVSADQGLNSIAPNSKATYPSTEYYTTQLSDPFSSLASPTPPSGPSSSCSSSDSQTYTCPPGVYATAPSFPGSGDAITINFTPGGNYLFQQGLVIPNNATVNFATGTYIFNGSTPFSTGSNDSLKGSSVLLYMNGGPTSFGNNNSISLSANSAYDSIAIWDATNGSSMTVGNNTNLGINVSITGGIYMPQDAFNTGANVTLAASFLVSDTANFGNNLNFTITSP